jgi:hypothetical protein
MWHYIVEALSCRHNENLACIIKMWWWWYIMLAHVNTNCSLQSRTSSSWHVVVLKKYKLLFYCSALSFATWYYKISLGCPCFSTYMVFNSNHFIHVLCVLASVGHGFRQSTYCAVPRHHRHVAMATPWWHLIATSMCSEGQLTVPCQMICTAMTLIHKPGPLWLQVPTLKFHLGGCFMLQLS